METVAINPDIFFAGVLILVGLITFMGVQIWTFSNRNRELESKIARMKIAEEIADMVILLGNEGNHESAIPVLETVTDTMKRYPALDRSDLEAVIAKLKAEL